MLTVPKRIETPRLLLERLAPGNLDDFARFLSTPMVTQHLAFPAETRTFAGAAQLLQDTLSSYDTESPVCILRATERATGAFAGCCGLTPLSAQDVELFYALLPEFWGRGLASEMASFLCGYIRRQTSFEKVHAFIVPAHSASMGVALKAGFHDVGLVMNDQFSFPVHRFEKKLDRWNLPFRWGGLPGSK